MKRYVVHVHPDAEAELVHAFRYIHADSPQNAERWLRGVWKVIDSLETMPERCPYARENDRFDTVLRQYRYKSHRIIFSVEGAQVFVHAVRHARRRELEDLADLQRKTDIPNEAHAGAEDDPPSDRDLGLDP